MNNEEYPDMDVVELGEPPLLVNAPPVDVSLVVEQFPNFPSYSPYLRNDFTHSSADLFPSPSHDYPWSTLGPLDPSIDFNLQSDGNIGTYHLPEQSLHPPSNRLQGPVTHPPHGYSPEFDMRTSDPIPQQACFLPQPMNRPFELGQPISPWPVSFPPSGINNIPSIGVSRLPFPIHFEEQQMQLGMVGDDANGIQQGMQDLSISTSSTNLEPIEDSSASNDMVIMVQAHEAAVDKTEPVPDPSDPWVMIRKKFFQLYIVEAKTLETAMLALKGAYRFHASPDQFKRRMRKWPECKKNRRADEPKTPKTVSYSGIIKPGVVESPRRTRDKKALARLKLRPIDQAPGLPLGPMIPAPLLVYGCATIQEFLIVSVNKYIKGFFDARTTTRQVLDVQYKTEWQWKALYNRCQAVSMIVQKRPVAMPMPAAKTRRRKPAQIEAIRQRTGSVIHGILEKHIFSEFAQTPCSPHMLVNFWNLCRALRGIAVRIQGDNTNAHVYILDCASALRSAFGHRTTNNHAGLMKILEYLVQVPPGQTKDTLELLCRCTAEILSTRLEPRHPLTLQAYVDYYRYWSTGERARPGLQKKWREQLCNEYQQSLEDSQAKFGRNDDRTIQILSSFAAAAYYIRRVNEHARRLAKDAWRRTAQLHTGTTTTRTQCMADAASILGIVCSTAHDENLRKTKKEMGDLKKAAGCNPRTKGGRRKYRKLAPLPPPPPAPAQVSKVAALLRQTVEILEEEGGWNSRVAVASLSSQLRSLERGRETKWCLSSTLGENRNAEPGQTGTDRPIGRAKTKRGSYHDEKSPWAVFATEEVTCFELSTFY
ncbi:hypothetical protein V8F06_013231 [Rhypophila decipiens]